MPEEIIHHLRDLIDLVGVHGFFKFERGRMVARENPSISEIEMIGVELRLLRRFAELIAVH